MRFFGRRHLGSTIALAVGVIALIAGFRDLAAASDWEIQQFVSLDSFVTGVVIIAGALAYRSAKKRRLGEVRSTRLRLTVELCELVVVVVPKIWLWAEYDHFRIDGALFPVWAIAAYLIINFWPHKAEPAAT